MNLIAKPSKDNIKTYVPIGLFLVSLSFLDVFVNAFFNFNLMGFLPSQLSYFLPLILDTDDSVAIMPTSPGLYKCVLESVIYSSMLRKRIRSRM